jgi:hypothetical protein
VLIPWRLSGGRACIVPRCVLWVSPRTIVFHDPFAAARGLCCRFRHGVRANLGRGRAVWLVPTSAANAGTSWRTHAHASTHARTQAAARATCHAYLCTLRMSCDGCVACCCDPSLLPPSSVSSVPRSSVLLDDPACGLFFTAASRKGTVVIRLRG